MKISHRHADFCESVFEHQVHGGVEHKANVATISCRCVVVIYRAGLASIECSKLTVDVVSRRVDIIRSLGGQEE